MRASSPAAPSLSFVDVSGPGADGLLGPSETVTFDLVLENNTQEVLLGISIIVPGFDEPDTTSTCSNGLTIVGGVTAASVFDQNVPSVGTVPGFVAQQPPFNSVASLSSLLPQSIETTLFEAINLDSAAETGLHDLGINENPVLGGGTRYSLPSHV